MNKILLILTLAMASTASFAGEKHQCDSTATWDAKRGYCVTQDGATCPKTMLWNSLMTTCVDRCDLAKNEMPLSGRCVHVCPGPMIQGIAGQVCSDDGRPGMSRQSYDYEAGKARSISQK